MMFCLYKDLEKAEIIGLPRIVTFFLGEDYLAPGNSVELGMIKGNNPFNWTRQVYLYPLSVKEPMWFTIFDGEGADIVGLPIT